MQNLRMGSTNIDEESLKSEIGVDRLMDFRKFYWKMHMKFRKKMIL